MPDIKQETLLSPTNVWLIGREINDLSISTGAGDHEPFIEQRLSNNNFLANQMKPVVTGSGNNQVEHPPRFARIYAFVYGGVIHDLETPALVMVHGDGADAETGTGRAARAPDNPSRTGLGISDIKIADGMKVWAYDKGDFSIRLDVSTGPLDQILLDLEGCDTSPGIAGARVSGARVSGARVSGARVSGARVSGARVSGARVSGARVGD
jgi:hypothetical protein